MIANTTTPGPWEVQHYAGGQIGVVHWDAEGSRHIITDHVWDTGPGAEANAQLIAAAPALLEALAVAAEYLKLGMPIHPGSHMADGILAALEAVNGRL
jgi:hypothetical protein